ncbi:MAG: DUF6782 family putative metallopeptidase [Geminicoccaceae bacterium]
MTIAILIAMGSRSEAEFLPETRSIDAQITRVVVERAHQVGGKKRFEERIHALIPDADRNCLQINHQPDVGHEFTVGRNPGTSAQFSLATALQQIRQSETGAWLVQFAAARNVTICLDRSTALEAHYRSHLRLLGLNARLDAAGRVVFLAHELAHVPQHPRFSNNRRFSPGDMLLLQRVREAAAEAVATRVLWQLRQQGFAAPWRKKLTTAYHDIAENFETTMAEGQGTARELWATRSAFHRWFEADWRLEIYDDLMLKTLTRIAEDPIGLIPASRHLSDWYLRGIADYAGQGFLIGGDGQALINDFRVRGLPAGDQARLNVILEKAENAQAPTLSSIAGEALSAVSSGPITADGNQERTSISRSK